MILVRHTFLAFLESVKYFILAVSITYLQMLFVSSVNANQLLEMRESSYNNIYIYKRGNIITMAFGHNKNLYIESEYNELNEMELPVIYTRLMTVGLAYTKSIESILEIGLGGGRTSWYMHKHLPDTLITAVEIDPEVVALAKKYFGIREKYNFNIITQDGRLYLKRNNMKYDLILIDAYRGPFVPFHLLTREFFSLVKSRLKPGGVVVQNVEPNTMLFDAAIATMKSVFNNVDIFEAGGNIVVVTYDGNLRSQQELTKRGSNLQKKYLFYHSLLEMVGKRNVLTNFPNRKPLTDDFAPVEYLKGIKKHNQKWN